MYLMSYILLQYLFISKVLPQFPQYCDYCDKKHTLCKYTGPSKECEDLRLTPLTSKDRDIIVVIHNSLRNEVALGRASGMDSVSMPTARDMRKIKWDNELEKIAERWAVQCIPFEQTNQHDECRFVGKEEFDCKRFDVGQNINTFVSDTNMPTHFKAMIMMWYNERKQFNYEKFEIDQKLIQLGHNITFLISHFAQMIYAEVEYIGCADVKFTSTIQINQFESRQGTVHRLVCNYGPAYDMDEKIYTLGKPCTVCPYGYACDRKYKGLCSEQIAVSETRKIHISLAPRLPVIKLFELCALIIFVQFI